MRQRRVGWLFSSGSLLLLLATACRGAAGRAAALPQPHDFAGALAIGAFVIGLWWVALKILRG
jgi:hypothetical protein